VRSIGPSLAEHRARAALIATNRPRSRRRELPRKDLSGLRKIGMISLLGLLPLQLGACVQTLPTVDAISVSEFNAAVCEAPNYSGATNCEIRASRHQIYDELRGRLAHNLGGRLEAEAAIRRFRPQYICVPWTQSGELRSRLQVILPEIAPGSEMMESCTDHRPALILDTRAEFVPWRGGAEHINPIDFGIGADRSVHPARFLFVGRGDQVDDRTYVSFAGASQSVFQYFVLSERERDLSVVRSYCFIGSFGASTEIYVDALRLCLLVPRSALCAVRCMTDAPSIEIVDLLRSNRLAISNEH
jgi:hypothetical protein